MLFRSASDLHNAPRRDPSREKPTEAVRDDDLTLKGERPSDSSIDSAVSDDSKPAAGETPPAAPETASPSEKLRKRQAEERTLVPRDYHERLDEYYKRISQ